jgi:hypothetical protein
MVLAALQYPWWAVYNADIVANDNMFANLVQPSQSETNDITVYENFVPNYTEIGGTTIETEIKPWRTGNFHDVYANNLLRQNEKSNSRRALLCGDQNVTSSIFARADERVSFCSRARSFSRECFEELLGHYYVIGMPKRALLEGGDYATANHSHDTEYLPQVGGSVDGNITCV